MAVLVCAQRHMCYECHKTYSEQPALLVAPKGGAVGMGATWELRCGMNNRSAAGIECSTMSMAKGAWSSSVAVTRNGRPVAMLIGITDDGS